MESKSYKKIFYPILAYSEKERQSKEVILNIWDKFDLLSKIDQEKISSIETAQKISRIASFFNLSEYQISSLSRAIRDLLFNDLANNDFAKRLSEESKLDQEISERISQEVFRRIIEDRELEKRLRVKTDNVSLEIALERYPGLRNQLISEKKLLLKDFHSEARPTIENWLNDYTSLLGYRVHDAIERGNYLFHSRNARNLRPEERERLAYVLKSFDEKIPIEINKENGQIIFPARNLKRPPVQKKTSEPKTIQNNGNIQKTSFGFHQKMPFESGKNRSKNNAISEKKKLPYPEDMLVSSKKDVSDKPTHQNNTRNVINLKDLD